MNYRLLKLIENLGYSVKKVVKDKRTLFPDIKEAEFWELYDLCKPYTMTSVERMYALYCSVNHVLANNIPGAFVECGVWRGGSAMMIARMLHNRHLSGRKIYLYDTFEGMSEPTNNDVDLRGKGASVQMKEYEFDKKAAIWCLADLEQVQENMRLTGYAPENFFYVKGKVEDTIPVSMPNENIALLRLDTDWYESTKHELIHLFPILTVNGIIIIDDYGYWEGCKKAVDEYMSDNNIDIFLSRVDYTARVGVKK